MKPNMILRSAVLALALATLPAAAFAQLKIIAVQARVGGTVYGVAPNEQAIPVRVGDRIRIELVGTSIERGRGVERPVNARFDVAGGRGQIDVSQAGPNAAVVSVRSGGGDNLAQVGYSVTGGYDMREGMRSGRITLQIAEPYRSATPDRGDRRDDRWDRAQELNRLLRRAILGADHRGDDRRDDVDTIYRDGSRGVRAVALDLARSEQRDHRYDHLRTEEAMRITGDLYRDLLGRDMSDREMWDRDRGFRNNVEALRRRGLEPIVDGIVTSEEFRTRNKLYEFDRMHVDRDRGRSDDDRGDRHDRDRRPPVF
jgi:hypothetical protein